MSHIHRGAWYAMTVTIGEQAAPPGTPVEAGVLADIRAREDEMLALTRQWVEVNSYTSNVAGVDRVGAMLREAFALPSLACTAIPGARSRRSWAGRSWLGSG